MTDATDTKRPLLVFLNEVAGGRGLLKAVRERTEAGEISQVIVAAPQNQPTIGTLIDRDELYASARARVYEVTNTPINPSTLVATMTVPSHPGRVEKNTASPPSTKPSATRSRVES